MLVAAVVLVVAIRMSFGGGQLFEHVDELFKSGVAGEELFNLGTKFRTFPSCLLVRKYVIVVLHDVFWESFGGIISFVSRSSMQFIRWKIDESSAGASS